MDEKKVLQDLGLSDGEIAVYLSLLKLGSVPVSKIKEDTGLHRTTIYDFVEKLLNKALISFVVENNIRYYAATEPEKLLTLVKEKEENIKEILPKLNELMITKKDKIQVEIYRGREGFKTFLNDVLRLKKDIVAFGIDETQFEEKFPILIEQYFIKEKKAGIKERVLTSENTKLTYSSETITYRYIPDKFFHPAPTLVYGDRVIVIVWEPFTLVMMKNKNLADSYKKHFELLWKQAVKKPRKK